jgi:hypothetical protein
MIYIWIIFPFAVFGQGLGDYSSKTPHNNEIRDSGNGANLYVNQNVVLESIQKWYFYKKTIIGEGYKSKFYFVFFEESKKIHVFENKNQWVSFLKQENLEPIFWTRWYSDDWTLSFFKLIVIWHMFLWWLLVPFELLICFLLIRDLFKKEFFYSRIWVILLISIITIFITNELLCVFPDSM